MNVQINNYIKFYVKSIAQDKISAKVYSMETHKIHLYEYYDIIYMKKLLERIDISNID